MKDTGRRIGIVIHVLAYKDAGCAIAFITVALDTVGSGNLHLPVCTHSLGLAGVLLLDAILCNEVVVLGSKVFGLGRKRCEYALLDIQLGS